MALDGGHGPKAHRPSKALAGKRATETKKNGVSNRIIRVAIRDSSCLEIYVVVIYVDIW